MKNTARYAGLCGLMLAVAWMSPSSAAALDLGSARSQILRTYEAYDHGEPDYAGRQAPQVFAPRLLALIRRDQATTPSGDVGILDGDPICDCQDPGGLKVRRLTLTAQGRQRARAKIILGFPGGTRTVELDLVANSAGWRISDIHTAETPSLVRLLEDGLARQGHHRNPLLSQRR